MFKLALCQIKGSFDKKESMATVTRYVETAAENGAQVPEDGACRCKADRASGCFQYDDRTGTLGYNDACACTGQSGIFCG